MWGGDLRGWYENWVKWESIQNIERSDRILFTSYNSSNNLLNRFKRKKKSTRNVNFFFRNFSRRNLDFRGYSLYLELFLTTQRDELDNMIWILTPLFLDRSYRNWKSFNRFSVPTHYGPSTSIKFNTIPSFQYFPVIDSKAVMTSSVWLKVTLVYVEHDGDNSPWGWGMRFGRIKDDRQGLGSRPVSGDDIDNFYLIYSSFIRGSTFSLLVRRVEWLYFPGVVTSILHETTMSLKFH